LADTVIMKFKKQKLLIIFKDVFVENKGIFLILIKKDARNNKKQSTEIFVSSLIKIMSDIFIFNKSLFE